MGEFNLCLPMVIGMPSVSIYEPRLKRLAGIMFTSKKACLKVSLENEHEKVVETRCFQK